MEKTITAAEASVVGSYQQGQLQSTGVSSARYLPRQRVFEQGDPADALYFVKEGRVQLSAVYSTGRLGIVGIAREGEFFGEQCLRGERVRTCAATAMTGATVQRLAKATAEQLLRSDAAFAGSFISHLLSRNNQLEDRLLDHLFVSSEGRLASVLLDLSNNGDGPPSKRIIPRPSHQTLAAIVGTTRPRISSFMRKFHVLGLIKSEGKALEVQRTLLEAVACLSPDSASRRPGDTA